MSIQPELPQCFAGIIYETTDSKRDSIFDTCKNVARLLDQNNLPDIQKLQLNVFHISRNGSSFSQFPVSPMPPSKSLRGLKSLSSYIQCVETSVPTSYDWCFERFKKENN